MFIIMKCPAFIIIYNNYVIISVIKQKAKTCFKFYCWGGGEGGFFFFGGGGGGGGFFFFFWNLSCMQTYDFTFFLSFFLFYLPFLFSFS